MVRFLSASALVLVVSALALSQDPKPQPKPKPKALPRIAINEPKEAIKDPDFAIQGEYSTKGFGVQVVAQGEGKFMVKLLEGGLPGAGWDRKKKMQYVSALREGSTTTVKENEKAIGTIAEGVLTISSGDYAGRYQRTERTSDTMGKKPPEGAVVLFSEPADTAKWNGAKVIELSDGKFLGVGEKTKQAFGSFTLHAEFRLPWMPNSRSQSRANSGVYLQDRYEVQVLDSFGLVGANNECAGLYTKVAPSVNMCLPPMLWQTYDIDFTMAGFDSEGKKTTPAKLTVLHNGVKVHDGVEIKGPTGGGQPETAKPGPIQLQNHNDPLVFRNVWIVEKN